jgi:hypothetical protein
VLASGIGIVLFITLASWAIAPQRAQWAMGNGQRVMGEYTGKAMSQMKRLLHRPSGVSPARSVLTPTL